MKDLLASIGYGFVITMAGIGGYFLANFAYYCIANALPPIWLSPIVGVVCSLFSVWTINQLENNNYDN